MDEQLKLNVEGYSPALVRQIVSQGGRYAFAEAAHNLGELAGLRISARHVERLTERVGAEWAERRDAEIELYKQDRLPRLYAQAPAVAAVMLDGGRAQTRQEPSGPGVTNPEWHEPKYGCFLTLDTKTRSTDPEPEPPAKFLNRTMVPRLVQQIQSVRAPAQSREASKAASRRQRRQKSRTRPSRYLLRTVIATMAAVDEFGYHVVVEVFRRGLDLAAHKACVCDGQKSNWTVWETHLKPLGFIPILDFLHLLTYLYAAAQARGGTDEERWARYRRWLTWAWQGARDKLLLALNEAAAAVGAPSDTTLETDPRRVVEKTRTYVTNNVDKMDYPRYRKLGLPISSAPVESAIKQFNKRVKGTEKFWRPSALEAVLQVRAAQLSDDDRTARFWAMPRRTRAAVRVKRPAA